MPTVDFEPEIAALRERMSELEKSRTKLSESNVALERENKILRGELALLKQGLFGRRTERLDSG